MKSVLEVIFRLLNDTNNIRLTIIIVIILWSNSMLFSDSFLYPAMTLTKPLQLFVFKFCF